jgi:hypothetical protein
LGGTTFNFLQEDVEPAGIGIAMTITGSHERSDSASVVFGTLLFSIMLSLEGTNVSSLCRDKER